MKISRIAIFGMLGAAAFGVHSAHARGPLRFEVPIGAGVAWTDPPREDWGLGLNLGFGVGPATWPLTLGVDLRPVLWSERTRPLVLPVGDGLFFPGDLTRRDETIATELWLRFHPLVWTVRPFIEGTAGVRFVEVEYSLRFRGADSSTTRSESSHHLTWGFGAGIDIPLMQSDGETLSILYGSLSVRYTKGDSAKAGAPVGGEQVSLGLAGDTIAVFLGITASIVEP